MNSRLPIVDSQGNINVHELEDLYLPVLPPAGGTLAGRTMSFALPEAGLEIALGVHPSNADAKVIHVTKAQLALIGAHSRFALIDSSVGFDKVKWAGTIRRYR